MHFAVLCDNSLKKDQTFTLLMTADVSNHLSGKNVSFQETCIEVTGISPQCRPLGESNTQNRHRLDVAKKHISNAQSSWLGYLT